MPSKTTYCRVILFALGLTGCGPQVTAPQESTGMDNGPSENAAVALALGGATDVRAALATNDEEVIRIDTNCWVACYKKDPAQPIHCVGVFPLPGAYDGVLCRPKEHADDDLSQVKEYAAYCAQLFPAACGPQQCWAGGDTGGLVGHP